jgi:hypothetical protein
MKHIGTMADIAREYVEAQRQWLKTRRVGTVSYDPQYNALVIDVRNGLTTYDIPFDEIQTPQQLTDWIFQLHEKSWMTGQHFRDLFECLEWVIREKTGMRPIQFYKVGGCAEN